MTKKNPLLEDEILKDIQEARYVEPKKEKHKRSIFYLAVIFLVTLAVVFSLLRYL